MANLVGYGRVSGEGQKDNTSLATQKEAIKHFCMQNNHKLIGYYQDVESGSTIELREGFQWALETVKEVADGMVVYRLDRLTRNVEDGEKLKKTFQKQGKLLLSVVDLVDVKSDDGSFVYTINTAIAELERKRIKTRCDLGREKKREEGGYLGGSPPYGYATYRKCLVELPSEQKIIALVRKLHSEGWPLSHIAKRLTKMGVPTKQRAKSGWRWTMIKSIVDGDSETVRQLRENGQILPASHWEGLYKNSELETG